MSDVAISVSFVPVNAAFTALAKAHCYELHWQVTPDPMDEGLSEKLVECLAQTFCDVGKVSFVAEPGIPRTSMRATIQELVHGAQWQQRPGSAWRRLQMPRINSKPLLLMETHDPISARALFDIQGWHIAPCQVVFITPHHAPHLPFSDQQIEQIIRNPWGEDAVDAFHQAAVRVCVTVGHDGAWLNVNIFNEVTLQTFTKALQNSCDAHGITVSLKI